MPTVDKETAKRKLKELVGRFSQIQSSGIEGTFSEADVSSKFILPLLDILGWNVSNINEVKEQRRTLSGPADYTLAISKKLRLVVELKKFTELLDGHRIVRGRKETFPEQATHFLSKSFEPCLLDCLRHMKKWGLREISPLGWWSMLDPRQNRQVTRPAIFPQVIKLTKLIENLG